MTLHTHATVVPGCYRCELGADEQQPAPEPQPCRVRAADGRTVRFRNGDRYRLHVWNTGWSLVGPRCSHSGLDLAVLSILLSSNAASVEGQE